MGIYKHESCLIVNIYFTRFTRWNLLLLFLFISALLLLLIQVNLQCSSIRHQQISTCVKYTCLSQDRFHECFISSVSRRSLLRFNQVTQIMNIGLSACLWRLNNRDLVICKLEIKLLCGSCIDVMYCYQVVHYLHLDQVSWGNSDCVLVLIGECGVQLVDMHFAWLRVEVEEDNLVVNVGEKYLMHLPSLTLWYYIGFRSLLLPTVFEIVVVRVWS